MLAAWGCRLANQEPIGCCSARRQVVRIHGRARSALRFVHKPAINHKFGNSRQLISLSPAKRPAFTAARTHCRVSMRFSLRKHTPPATTAYSQEPYSKPTPQREPESRSGTGSCRRQGDQYFEEDLSRCGPAADPCRRATTSRSFSWAPLFLFPTTSLSPLRTAANLQWRCECTLQPERRPSASAIPTRRFKLRPAASP